MRMRVIALALLLATALGLFGCTATPPTKEGGTEENTSDGFISADSDAVLGDEETPESDSSMNLAATDEKGAPLFQIVYVSGVGLRVREQCEALAADIYAVTGVTLPVVHSLEKQSKYEITVGRVARVETIDVIDGFTLSENDFAIKVVDTRVLIYAVSDQALISAILFFTEQLVQRSEEQKTYGVETDLEFIYRPSEKPTATMGEVEDDRYVHFTLQDGAFLTYVRLSYTGNKGWRLQTKYREADSFRDNGASQVLAYSLGEYELGTEDARFYTEKVETERVGNLLRVSSADGSRAELSLDAEKFSLRFYTAGGALSAELLNIAANAGGSTLTGTVNDGEAIFGTGERFNAANQRGKLIEMFTKDIWSSPDACYMVIPLLSFSRGSGIFLNNYEHMMLDLDSNKKGTWTASITGAPIDCYVFTTEKIPEVINAYSKLSGFANMPEEWTYGMLVCGYAHDFSGRWTEESSGEGIYDAIAKMEAYGLPWTGILAEPWGGYNIKKNHDALKELCDYVHSLGKKFLLYVRMGESKTTISGFDDTYHLTQTLADGSLSAKLPDTTAGTNNPDVGTGSSMKTYLDITNPDAVAWYFDEYWEYLTNVVGVDGCKIDFCETLPENYELNYYDSNVPTAGSHHWYPSAYCAMFYDMLAKKPDGGMCFTRGGGIGAQRAPYMWAGDQVRSFGGIQWQLTGLMSSGLSGVPFMSYDMSGYRYAFPATEIEREGEVFIRGTQFSAYTICIQTHGNVRRPYLFADYTDENGDHPYAYVTELYSTYVKLHEHLTPYITELSEEAHTTGMPVVRHLVLQYQNDANVYNIENEFMLGDAFLIAPILNEASTRNIYLPEGTWTDLNTGERHVVGAEGKEIPAYPATLAELPTFYNEDNSSTIAKELVPGIMDLYDYARTLLPAQSDVE